MCNKPAAGDDDSASKNSHTPSSSSTEPLIAASKNDAPAVRKQLPEPIYPPIHEDDSDDDDTAVTKRKLKAKEDSYVWTVRTVCSRAGVFFMMSTGSMLLLDQSDVFI